MKRILAILVPSLSAALACTTSPSSEFNTAGLYPEIAVTAEGQGRTEVTVRLKHGIGEYVELVDGDRLEATAGGQTLALANHSALGATWYAAEFASDTPGTAFTITLLRTEEEDAPDSHATLPSPVAPSSPVDGSVVAWSDPTITINWESAEPVEVAVEGSCIRNYEAESPSAPLMIEVPALLPDDMKKGTCDVTVTIRRCNEGELDPAFDKGEIRACQERAVQFELRA